MMSKDEVTEAMIEAGGLEFGARHTNCCYPQAMDFEANLAAEAIYLAMRAADTRTQPVVNDEVVARLSQWARQHSDVTPLDGTDRDSPTFGDLRYLLSRLVTKTSEGVES